MIHDIRLNREDEKAQRIGKQDKHFEIDKCVMQKPALRLWV